MTIENPTPEEVAYVEGMLAGIKKEQNRIDDELYEVLQSFHVEYPSGFEDKIKEAIFGKDAE